MVLSINDLTLLLRKPQDHNRKVGGHLRMIRNCLEKTRTDGNRRNRGNAKGLLGINYLATQEEHKANDRLKRSLGTWEIKKPCQ